MYSEFIKSNISLMGVSNIPEMLLSEKDLNAVEFNFLVRPTLEFQRERLQIGRRSESESESESYSSEEDPGVVHHYQKRDHHDQVFQEVLVQNRNKEKEEDKFEVLVSTLKLKIPSQQIVDQDHDQENTTMTNGRDGFKTPTSLDNKIPATLQCPPAPRKPKSLPSTMKRKANHRRVFLDLTSEIESLFPPTVLADLRGGKIKKKVRQGNANIL